MTIVLLKHNFIDIQNDSIENENYFNLKKKKNKNIFIYFKASPD